MTNGDVYRLPHLYDALAHMSKAILLLKQKEADIKAKIRRIEHTGGYQ